MRWTSDLLGRIHLLSQYKQRPVTLKQLFDFGSNPSNANLLVGAQYLHQELPVRLAHRVRELENLPYGLSEMPSVVVVRDMYIESTRDFIEFPRPECHADDTSFVGLMDRIKTRHNSVLTTMAQGVLELKRRLAMDAIDADVQQFLDRFYMSRIGIRMLIGQHVALHQRQRPGYVGLICEKCYPRDIIETAAMNAATICRLRLGLAPKVGVFGRGDLTFTYVPSHLEHMLFELLKNSMRAVVERHVQAKSSMRLPEIRVVIAEGEEDVTIKISDEGGGIPRSGISQIWTYLYSTAPPPDPNHGSGRRSDFDAPLAGYGYGLPISRLYSRYFGGDLQVISMEGYGTDAYLHLRRLGNTEEALR